MMKAKLAILIFVLAGITVQAQSKWGKTPEDSIACLENTSLYVEFYKQKNYNDAKGPWRKCIDLCPTSSKNLYIKGVNMYKNFIVNEKDKDKRNILIDTLMWIYDQRIQHFGQKGYVLGRKGADLLRYSNGERLEEAYGYLKESFDLQGIRSERGAITSYYQAAEKMHKAGKLSKEDLLMLFPPLANAVEEHLKTAKDEKTKDKWMKALSVLETIFSRYADCEDLVEIYQPKFNENQEDTNMLIQIIALFEKRGCTEDDLFLQASIALDKIKPSGVSKFGIGRSLLKKERFSEAARYFREGAELSEIKEVKIKNLQYAAQTYMALKNYKAAKDYALKMLRVDPNNGMAYFIIGDAYYYGSKTVGENDCEKAGGLWAAIPKYQKAKSLDPSLAEKANKKIASVKSHFPKKEDCFFYNMLDGQPFHVGGWINEDVTIKTN